MGSTKNAVRITDLATPVQTPEHQQAIQQAVNKPVSLTTDAILEAASSESGVGEYLSDNFRNRLDVWLELAEEDPNLTALGRLLTFQRAVSYAATRGRLDRLLRQYPEIHNVKIREPIIILGPFRSGTTHLHGLLSADSRLRYLRAWEANEPIPPPNGTTSDSRITRYNDAWHWVTSILPLLPAMHNMAPFDPDEETELQGADFPLWLYQSTALTPLPRDLTTDESDDIRHYSYMKLVLKALQWQQGPSRWILKSTHHCERVHTLLATFPDAIVIMTHRDPLAVVRSTATLASYMARRDYDTIDTAEMGEHWYRRIDKMLRNLLESQHIIPPERLLHINFHEFMADELNTVDHILSIAGLGMPAKQQNRVLQYQSQHPRGKYGQIKYDLRDFGLRPNKLQERFKFYYDATGIRPDR